MMRPPERVLPVQFAQSKTHTMERDERADFRTTGESARRLDAYDIRNSPVAKIPIVMFRAL